MNILFTICGRAGSKGLKNKNLKLFLNKPLLYYTMAAIELYTKRFSKGDTVEVCLNTDSEDLVAIALQRDSSIIVLNRSPELSGDLVSKISVIKDCLSQVRTKNGIDYDIVVDLDITSPLRTVQDVKNAIDKKKGLPETDVVFSVTSARRNPYFNMVICKDGLFAEKAIPSKFTARQQAPDVYDMNASIYAYSPAFLKNNQSGLLFDGVCGFIEMLDTAVLDIDSEEDFRMMEIIGSYLFSENPGMKEIFDHIR